MAVYLVSPTSIIPDIRAALEKAGILTTLHYESGTSLVVTTARVNKVLKFVSNSYGLSIYYGDAWTSGTTITNQVQVSEPYVSAADSGAVIITPDILAISMTDTNNSKFNTIFGRLDNGEYFVMSGTTISNAAYIDGFVCRNITTGVNIYPYSLGSGTLTSTDGFYYTVPLFFTNGAGVVFDFRPIGISIILKPIPAAPYELLGTEVGAYIGYYFNSNSYFNRHVLITGGNA